MRHTLVDDPRVSEETIDRSPKVSTLELFFDLVFVFTITQLTGLLVDGSGAASAVQVAVLLAVIWWMYDGYAWLTNAIATDLVRFRLLLLGGMGGFLVMAMTIPNAYEGEGLDFALAYLVVVLLHAGMYARGTSVGEVAAILRIVPYNLTAALLVLVGGARRVDGRRTFSGCSPRSCFGSPRGSRTPRASSSRRGTSSSGTGS
jgi:low temperature requirement protein LtrA